MTVVSLPDGRSTVLLSTHDETLIAADARAVLDYIDRVPCSVTQVAAQLLGTRRARRHRVAVRAADRDELIAGLRAVIDGTEHPLVAGSARRVAARTAFVFPGQGGQWPSMGADAYRLLPVYRAEADRLDAAFRAAGFPSPLVFLTTTRHREVVSQLELQGAQFVHAVALAAVWRSCGILPDLTIGHSLGEIAAAYVADTITIGDAVAVLAARAYAVERFTGGYRLAVLGVGADSAAELIAATPGWLEISAVNASSSVVVAGERDAITALVAAVEQRGLFVRELAVDFPAHTSALEPLHDELLRRLPRSTFAESAVQFLGSATGGVVAAGTDFGPYWYANLRNVIRFDQAVRSAIAGGAATFAEMSAHPALLFALTDGAEDSDRFAAEPAVIVGSGRRDESLADRLAGNIVATAVADPGYRWADLLDTVPAPLRGFPGAPMRSTHLWATAEPLPPVAGLTVAVESWRRATPRIPAGGAPRTIAVLGSGATADRLRDAIPRLGVATIGEPADAETLVVIAPPSAADDAATTVSDLARDIDAGLLDYVAAIGVRCRDVWLVTTGAECVLTDDPPADLGQAGLAAMHRCIGFEHADQRFHHLDLPSVASVQDGMAAVVYAILGETGEVALRNSGTEVYRRALTDDTSSEPGWPSNSGLLDNVVITGGSGTVGLAFARHLADRGAKRIVLLSRRGVEPSLLEGLRTTHSIEITAPRCDIVDRGQLTATAADHAPAAASLVIHAAGSAALIDRSGTTGSTLLENATAKIVGLENVVALWPIRDDARILLCSSVTGVWGGLDVAAYAAANRMLDVLAVRLRDAGHRCLAVRYGLWEGSRIIDAAEIARAERMGLRQMKPELAVEASMYDYRQDPVILAADPGRLRAFLGAADAADTPDPGAIAGAAHVGNTTMIVDTADVVRSQLAAVLDIDPETEAVDLESSLFDLGVDSLLALDLRNRLKRTTGRTVALATLLGGITGTDLIADLDTPHVPEKVDHSRD
jgi:mycobactin polyketide synthetase MbtD